MKIGVKYLVGVLTLVGIGIGAGIAFAGSCDVSVQAQSPAVMEVDCPKGYQNCYGEPVYEELVDELNWCNTAWSGRADQDNPDGIVRVREWETVDNVVVHSSYDETVKQREIRLAAGGWVVCDALPRERRGVRIEVVVEPTVVIEPTSTPTATPTATATPRLQKVGPICLGDTKGKC